MSPEGLTEVHNASLLFMEERTKELPGSVIIPALEGSRSLLVEVQALVAPSSFSTSTRKSTGLDHNRLSLLLAVLEKKMGYQLYNCDIFVCIAGGLKIFEPAIDLGVIVAIASSFCNRCIDSSIAIVGEVGLGGEVRAVSRVENRIREVIHMGFTQCVIPKSNMKGLSTDLGKKIRLIQVEAVEEAIHELM
jgi:DNA repair protein RadA/Sms